jgi:WD domain, G-beta repeat/WD40-like Beta Propeller Repeat
MRRRFVSPVLNLFRGRAARRYPVAFSAMVVALLLLLGGMLVLDASPPEIQSSKAPLPAGAVARLGRPLDFNSRQPQVFAAGHQAWVAGVAFTPDSQSLVSAAVDEVLSWDLGKRTVTISFRLKAPHPEKLIVAANGRHLLVRDRGTILIYDLQRGMKAAFKSDIVWCCSADGRTLVQTGPPVPGFRCLLHKRDPAGSAYPLALTPSGDILVERLFDNSIRSLMRRDGPSYAGLRLRDSASGEELVTLKNHAAGALHLGAGNVPLVFSPNGKMMAGLLIPVAHGERTLVLWETQTGLERLRLATLPKYNSAALAFSPDGRVLAFARCYRGGPSAGPIHLLDLTLGKEERKPLVAEANCLAFSRDGKFLASGNQDSTVLVWDATRFAAVPRAVPLPVPEFEKLWKELAASDGGRAYRALCRLLASPGPAVKLLRERIAWCDLAPEVNRLVKELGSSTFKTREKAAAALEALADRGRPLLKRALTNGKLSLEQRLRVEKVISRLGMPFSSPSGIRLFRAMEVLERIGSTEAVALLRQIGAGPAGSPLTAEAQRALRRLQKPL